jgi:hypothetical protein
VHPGTETSSQVNTVSQIILLKFTVVYGISDFHPFVVFFVGPRSESTVVNRSGFDSVGCTKTYSNCAYNFMNNVEISKD